MRKQHESESNAVTLCGVRKAAVQYGMITKDVTGIKLEEKPEIDFSLLGKYVNCPVFYAQRTVFDYIREMKNKRQDTIDFSKDIIPAIRAEGQRLGVYIHNGFYYDIGTRQAYEAVKDLQFYLLVPL